MGKLHFELKILDEDFRKLDFWKFDEKDLPKMLRAINSKHSLGIKIKEQVQEDDDLNWMR